MNFLIELVKIGKPRVVLGKHKYKGKLDIEKWRSYGAAAPSRPQLQGLNKN